jgi:hypothetical protein
MISDYYQKCSRVYAVGKLSPLYPILCEHGVLPKVVEEVKEEKLEDQVLNADFDKKSTVAMSQPKGDDGNDDDLMD